MDPENPAPEGWYRHPSQLAEASELQAREEEGRKHLRTKARQVEVRSLEPDGPGSVESGQPGVEVEVEVEVEGEVAASRCRDPSSAT